MNDIPRDFEAEYAFNEEDFNYDAIDRLRWSIFDPAGTSGILVADKPQSPDPELTPYTQSHPIASEPILKSLARKIVFFVDALNQYESNWNDEFDFVDPHPEPERMEDCWGALVVQRKDNEPLTVGDIIAQLHAHFNRPFIRDRIREALAWMYDVQHGCSSDGSSWISIPEGGLEFVPEEVRIILGGIQNEGKDVDEDVHQMSISLWVEGNMGKDADYFWKHGAP